MISVVPHLILSCLFPLEHKATPMEAKEKTDFWQAVSAEGGGDYMISSLFGLFFYSLVFLPASLSFFHALSLLFPTHPAGPGIGISSDL